MGVYRRKSNPGSPRMPDGYLVALTINISNVSSIELRFDIYNT